MNKKTDSIHDSALVTIQEKHPLWIRWAHWINFPVLTLMIWSGAMIYWASPVYWPSLPNSFYQALNLNQRLAEGLAYHFFFMWIFTINGILYFLYLLFSGEWREMLPGRAVFQEAWQVFLHDLGINKNPVPRSKFNAAQRLAYSAVIFMGLGSILTGVMIYKPAQLSWLGQIVGGYQVARLLHYILTLGYLIFFVVHIAQVIRAGWNNFRAMITGTEKVEE